MIKIISSDKNVMTLSLQILRVRVRSRNSAIRETFSVRDVLSQNYF
jgi:hypothetical protein